MPVDYSKWDALELSDDSDIEVHPNVDKRSFIRAKQNQIHQERQARKHEIATLKYERIINDGLLERIDRLVGRLKELQTAESIKAPKAGEGETASETAGEEEAKRKRKVDDQVFQALMKGVKPSTDKPPDPPAGIHSKDTEKPTYSKMMASLVDQVKGEVETLKASQLDRLSLYVREVGKHRDKVANLQKDLIKRLAELDRLEAGKITSESIHTGFSSSHVTKHADTSDSKDKGSESVELLNPSSSSKEDTEPGPPAPDAAPLPTRDIQPSSLGRRFAALPPNSYPQYLSFIKDHPSVLAERETDGLLMQAFDLQYAGDEKAARHSVHQALLLQYCRGLSTGTGSGGSGGMHWREGVELFFRRIGTPGHNAQKVFGDDVASTYIRLRERSRDMIKESVGQGIQGEVDAAAAEQGGAEQIQLHPVNPGEKILIVTPRGPPKGADEKDEREPDEVESRRVFESFKPDMQKALETGSLDEVNKVLGKMEVDEAEALVGQLSEGGMLSLQSGVLDATTEEGRKQLAEMEKLEKEKGVAAAGDGESGRVIEEIGEPGGVETSAEEEKKAVDQVD